MTEQTAATPQTPAPGDAAPNITADDLSLIDPNLEDHGKDEAEIWKEFEQDETGKSDPPDDEPPADEQGRDEPGDKETGKDAAQDAPSSPQEGTQEGEKPDPWSSAPPELKDAYEALKAEKEAIEATKAKLEQRIRSDDGRVAAYQRRIKELTQAAGKKEPSRQASVDARAAIEGIAEQYPDIAQPLQKVLDALDSRIEKLDERETSRTKAEVEEIEAHVRAETEKLETEHPDWFDVISRNAAAFDAWVEDQPRRIREAAYRNSEHIISASEAAEVVAAFKKHLGASAEPPAAQPPQNVAAPQAAQPASPAQPNTPPNSELNDRRKRQLAGSAS